MQYPWWSVSYDGPWGTLQNMEPVCLSCAEKDTSILLGDELTDSEIDELGNVSCAICGRTWSAPPELKSKEQIRIEKLELRIEALEEKVAGLAVDLTPK